VNAFLKQYKYNVDIAPDNCNIKICQKGIEVDPDKVRAILEMPHPCTKKEVRCFLGRLNYIARFIPQLTSTCEPIFKLLRENQTVE